MPPQVVTIGAHIADAHAWPFTFVPDGQQLQFVEKMTFTVAGTAAGTAIDLAKLGVDVASVGRVGEDTIGDFIRTTMAGRGIDVSAVRTTDRAQTSASLLPIRPDGSRPALHVVGANAILSEADVPWDVVAQAKVVHMGGVFVLPGLDGAPMARVLERVKSLGVLVTMDFLMSPRDDAREVLTPSLPFVDYLMPNIEEAGWLVGTEDRTEIISWLHEKGVGTTLLTLGGDGVSISVRGAAETVLPAFAVDVVDTTGCGDAFTAGFISGLLDGLAIEESATRGLACGSLVATGLGSDAGIVDLAQVKEFIADAPRIA